MGLSLAEGVGSHRSSTPTTFVAQDTWTVHHSQRLRDQTLAVSGLSRLLPPEHRFALLVLSRQQTHPTPTILRIEQNYGREGVALAAAGLMWGNIGVLFGLVGMISLVVSGDHGAALAIGYILCVAGLTVEIPALTRVGQAIHTGRRFRRGWPSGKAEQGSEG
jgi:hypothetical protein